MRKSGARGVCPSSYSSALQKRIYSLVLMRFTKYTLFQKEALHLHFSLKLVILNLCFPISIQTSSSTASHAFFSNMSPLSQKSVTCTFWSHCNIVNRYFLIWVHRVLPISFEIPCGKCSCTGYSKFDNEKREVRQLMSGEKDNVSEKIILG